MVAAWLHLPPLLRGCVLPLLPLFAASIYHRGSLVSASGCSLAALLVVVSRCIVVLAHMRGVRGCSKVFAPRLRLGCLSPRLRLGYLCSFVNYTLQMYRAKCPKHFLTYFRFRAFSAFKNIISKISLHQRNIVPTICRLVYFS